jgi:hypothetical protein
MQLELTSRQPEKAVSPTPLQIFPGMAHDMMLEPGWEAAAERILAWLGQQPPATSRQ